jgi:hypothetical protein
MSLSVFSARPWRAFFIKATPMRQFVFYAEDVMLARFPQARLAARCQRLTPRPNAATWPTIASLAVSIQRQDPAAFSSGADS